MDELLLKQPTGANCVDIHTAEEVQAFGPSLLPAKFARGDLGGVTILKDRIDARRELRVHAPETPGIYGYFDRHGQLNYVGKSKCLRKRLLSYFAKNPPDDKMTRIVQNSKFIRWEPVSHELLALIREQELISRWRPTYNRQGQPQRKQPAFLCVSNLDAGHVFVKPRITAKSKNCYGPIPGSQRLRETAEDLNSVFRLRDCNEQTPMHFSDQLQLFPQIYAPGCLRFETGSCTGPCTGRLLRHEYSDQVQLLTKFLEGEPNNILERLAIEMDNAARKRAFEKAIMLREQIQNLKWVSNRLLDLRKARYDLNCIYPLPGFRKQTIWLCLSSGMINCAIVRPLGRNVAKQTIARIKQLDASACIQLPHEPEDILMQLILTSWFRKHKEEKKNLLSFGKAISHCESRL